MFDSQVLAFTLAALLVTISPGPDTFLVIGNSARGGLRHGLATVAGVVCGGLFHAALFGFGVAQVLAYSPRIFTTVKLLGAAYLVYLGIGALRAALWGRSSAVRLPDSITRAAATPGTSWRQGLLSNALNPKVTVFYLAFLPQFMSPGDPIATTSVLLIGIHCLLGLLWLSSLVLAVTHVSGWLRRSAVRRSLDALVGGVMIAFGAKLAFEKA